MTATTYTLIVQQNDDDDRKPGQELAAVVRRAVPGGIDGPFCDETFPEGTHLGVIAAWATARVSGHMAWLHLARVSPTYNGMQVELDLTADTGPAKA